ncbi:DegV family protein [Solicola gregarius]|uniref:DegV family protein n=1 Tax=Solicola gregarius TaxID=2908642 RepID=A0AA46TJ17_9ACTN|nr:DegV family protein [Solicola gregarius]UYM05762.1 DegV family protein [Solicola gregarius]
MSDRIAIVTDSTSSLPVDVAERYDVRVVPLQVVVGDDCLTEGVDITASDIASALEAHQSVSTSRPAPEVFVRTYAELADSGASQILSIHLSAEVSGTFESAQIAARTAPVPVHCVDSRQVGMGTGYAALSAAELLADAAPVEKAIAAAKTRGDATATYFYVDTLEYLRRGGRVSTLGALVGSALAVKPLLTIDDGRIGPLEKVRTSARALNRLQELAVAFARRTGGTFDVAVQHLSAEARARDVADALREELALDDLPVLEVGAAIGAHVGPGMVAVVVAPRL